MGQDLRLLPVTSRALRLVLVSVLILTSLGSNQAFAHKKCKAKRKNIVDLTVISSTTISGISVSPLPLAVPVFGGAAVCFANWVRTPAPPVVIPGPVVPRGLAVAQISRPPRRLLERRTIDLAPHQVRRL